MSRAHGPELWLLSIRSAWKRQEPGSPKAAVWRVLAVYGCVREGLPEGLGEARQYLQANSLRSSA